jgi:hypothetical protein
MRIEEGIYRGEDLVSGEISGRRKEMTTWPGRRGPLSVREGEDRLYRFGKSPGWAAGRLWCWAGMAPPALLFIFLSFFFFLFLVFLFLSYYLQI